ncbi:ABC-F type ribosomal protection protein [Tumebacillus sp. DT12]|uniref:ABC-F type ribosomal protection protein n=1 Tax=Tumebacillus lacus TaxID=2995335 RepID=A0ABT3X3U1_9BACL|nr:ABC-F type ribosomal protection protein [Tumebacillus lacus]MCX7571563.1 ABC-F type ribosomal protection protein [Tumebacillus lacus]
MIINCQQVQKYYGAQLVLSELTFEIREGERVGLIGANGAGKSTLFKMLTRETTPDSGLLTIRKGLRIGSLAQVPDYRDGTRVYEVLARGYEEVRSWQARITVLEAEMTEPDVYENEARLAQVLAEYDRLREAFERAGGYEMEAQIERVAHGLGIAQAQYDRPFASLSGGEKTKVGLAALLIEQPDLLLLDEPTNHLDMHAVEWLEEYLRGYAGTFVVISHDRWFLDQVVTKVIEIEDGEAAIYHTNYTAYQQEKEERLLQLFNEYQEQQKKINKMQETIKQLYEWGRRGSNEKFFRRAQSMQKALDRIQRVKKPVMERRQMDLQLQMEGRSGKQVAVFDEVTKTFGTRTLFNGLSERLVYGERIALIGANGAGKSTLFKLLLGQLRPDAGRVTLGANVAVGYLAQEQAPESDDKTVLQYFREEARMEEGRARGELARFLFYGASVFKAVKNLSGGEWSRLRLALLMYERPNLLLLDEPTNHLDIPSREALEEALEDYPGTVLVISHDRYFINSLVQKIWSLEAGQLTRYEGNFHYYLEKRPDSVVAVAPVQAEQPVIVAPEPEEKKRVNPYVKARLEETLTALEAKIAGLDSSIADPAHATDAALLADLCRQREETQEEYDNAFEQWMELEGESGV